MRDTSSARGDHLPTRFLLMAAAVGLTLRLAFGFFYWTDRPLTRDEQEYLSLARSLAAGRGFVYDDALPAAFLPFGRAPGYPSYLALVDGGRDAPTATPPAVKATQSMVGALGVVLAGIVAFRFAGVHAARAAAGLAAIYPPLVWTSGYVLSEAVFWPLGLGIALGVDAALARERRGWGIVLIAGLMIGVGILTRPALMLFLPLLALWCVLTRAWRPLALMAAGVAIVVAPWIVRNYAHHGRLVIVASDGGVTFWTGNHPLAIGEGDMAANITLKRDHQRLRETHPGLTEEEMEPIYYAEAFAWIRTHPLDWVALEARKVFYLIVPIGPSYTLHSRTYYAASALSYLCLLPLSLFGFVAAWTRVHRTPGLWLLTASAVLVCLVFFPQERFRTPVIDPALIVAAGAGWSRLRAGESSPITSTHA